VSFFGKIIGGELSVGKWANLAAEIGLDAIDLSILFLKSRDPEYLRKMRDEIESAGMSVAVVNTYPDFTHPNSIERKHQVSQLQRDIAASAALGARFVRVTAGQAHPETSRNQGVDWFMKGLRLSLEAGERYGVKLVYENHSKPGIWDYYDFSHPSDIFLEIARGTQDTSLKILFDTANPLVCGDDPLSILNHVIDRVVCVHAADIREKGALEPVVLGTGIVPFIDIFSTLKGAGFDGWVCIEEASGTGNSGLKEAVRFVRRAWDEAGVP